MLQTIKSLGYKVTQVNDIYIVSVDSTEDRNELCNYISAQGMQHELENIIFEF